MRPLLSICIPTFNSADFLRIMLQALLPQSEQAGPDVEVIVLDNGSTDETPRVLETLQTLGAFRVIRHPRNLGPAENVVQGPREHAIGTFSWILGHHNLLRPDALTRVLAALRNHSELDLFYANFRCATYPDHWPSSAPGGYDGGFSYLGNNRRDDSPVARWSELIQPQSALCTQVYAHIVKTRIWQEYWRGRPIPPSYTSGLSTYPHTWMLAETSFQVPAFYIGEPVITIFNGAQSWGDLPTKLRVYLCGLPELMELYKKQGMTTSEISNAYSFCRNQHQVLMLQAFEQSPESIQISTLFRTIRELGLRHRWLWSSVWYAFICAQACSTSRVIRFSALTLDQVKRYGLHDCRPARWLRARREREAELRLSGK